MTSVIIITLLVCIGLILFVLFKPSTQIKGHNFSIYWVVVFVGALSLILMRFISVKEVVTGLTNNSSINPLKILILFLSMSMLSIFLDEINFFKYLANKTLSQSKTSQKTLFLYLYIIVSVLTVFTSNDIIILTFTPFICYFSKNAKINPIPYLFCEFVAANTWSMLLVIGNPTNVYLATANNISFLEYSSTMFLSTILAGITAFIVLFFVFRKSLSKPIESEPEVVVIKDKGMLIIGLAHLAACTILLVVSSYIGLEMWLITLLFALSLYICVFIYKLIKHMSGDELTNCFKRAPWELVPFILSMFVIVLALDKFEVTNAIAHILGNSNNVATYGVASFLSANLVNNIPMSVLFSSVIQDTDTAARITSVYATIIGSNLGALFSPIGALAGIMWSNILKKNNVKFSFAMYEKYGVLISIPTLFIALLGLYII